MEETNESGYSEGRKHTLTASELRIGNWVKLKDLPTTPYWQVESVGNLIMVGGQLWSIEELEPIPLTEEFLIKIGFIRQGGRKMWVKDKLCIELKELPNIRGEFIEGWYVGLKDLGNVLFHSFMKVNHVHQLQNLYYGLCGEELTI